MQDYASTLEDKVAARTVDLTRLADERRADVSRDIAESRDVPVDVVHAVEGHAVVRLASLIVLADWVSVYAAISLGIDLTPIVAINEPNAIETVTSHLLTGAGADIAPLAATEAA